MSQFFQWCRSLVPIATPVAVLMWIGFAATSIIKLANGSFAWISTAEEVAYIACAFAIIPLVAGLLCAILVDVCLRLVSRIGSLR